MKYGHEQFGDIQYWYVQDQRLGDRIGKPDINVRLWCFETYGKQHNPQTWSILHETITFQNEQDYMLYVLTWA